MRQRQLGESAAVGADVGRCCVEAPYRTLVEEVAQSGTWHVARCAICRPGGATSGRLTSFTFQLAPLGRTAFKRSEIATFVAVCEGFV